MMRNMRIGAAIAMVIGLSLYFVVPESFDKFAGIIFGAGFGLFIYSSFKKIPGN